MFCHGGRGGRGVVEDGKKADVEDVETREGKEKVHLAHPLASGDVGGGLENHPEHHLRVEVRWWRWR